MKQSIFTIVSNEALTDVVYKMVLSGDTSAITNCGQFVDLRLPEKYQRRPISVCDYDGETLTLIYKVVGSGTEIMASLPAATRLDVLTGLGNGYDTTLSGQRPVLVGGGVGVPPMYNLCKKLIAEGKEPQVVLGFNTAAEIFLADEFKALGAEVHIATADGSVGTRGFVTDVLKNLSYTYFYSCGPMPMFRAMEHVMTTQGQYSFEERMGCGFGACMGCTIRPEMATSGSARTAPYSIVRRFSDEHQSESVRHRAGQSRDPRLRHLRLRQGVLRAL